MFFQGLRKNIGHGIKNQVYTLWKEGQKQSPDQERAALLRVGSLPEGPKELMGAG